MTDFYNQLQTLLDGGLIVAVATIVQTKGSTPRGVGTKMIIHPYGKHVGTVGGGCGEAEVWQEAMVTLEDGKARIVTVNLTEPTDGEDKICGGIMDVFVERIG